MQELAWHIEKDSPLHFQPVSEPQMFQRLASLGQAREFLKGELICQAGDSANYIYLLDKGRAKIYHIGNNGKELLLWFCCNGDVFGLNEALQNRKRTTYVQACSDCTVITIPRARFLTQLSLDPETAMHVITILSARLHQVGQRMMRLVASDVQERVRMTLANLAEQYGVREDKGMRIEMRITHQDLADMVGTSRQSVTSILNELKRQGIIHFAQRHLWVREDQLTCSSRLATDALVP